MARTGMTTLIDTLRGYTDAGTADYTVGTLTYWSDDEIQRALDRRRTDNYRIPIYPQSEYTGGGTIEYKKYYIGVENWEETSGGTAIFTIEDNDGDKIGTANWSADYTRGFITFTANQGGTAYYVTGSNYDLNGAAADIWNSKAAHYARAVNFSTDNHSISRGDLIKNALTMSNYYRNQSGMRVIQVYREDCVP
jgi:hypothetical protein